MNKHGLHLQFHCHPVSYHDLLWDNIVGHTVLSHSYAGNDSAIGPKSATLLET